MLTPIRQGDTQHSLVHVFGRAVSRPIGAVNLAAESNGYEGGT